MSLWLVGCEVKTPTAPLQWQYHFSTSKEIPAVDSWQETERVYFTDTKPNNTNYLWLRTKLPPSLSDLDVLFIDDTRYKFSVFVNNRMIYNQEEHYNSYFRQLLASGPYFISLQSAYANQEIMIRVYSDINRIGLMGQVSILDKDALYRRITRSDFSTYLQAFFFFSIALICLSLLIIGRRMSMIFGLMVFSAMFAVYSFTLLNGKFILYDNGPWWLSVAIVSFCLLPGLFGWLISSLFEEQSPVVFEWLTKLSLLLGGIIIIGHFTGLLEFHRVITQFQYFIVLAAVMLQVQLLFWAKQGSKLARPLAYSLLMLLLAIVHDVMVNRGFFPWSTHLSGAFVMLFFIHLSLKIAELVNLREKENEIYLTEMDTAKHLQKIFLGKKTFKKDNLELQISNVPATKLGGDWFHHYEGKNAWYYIHLGDITGHGVQSALTMTFLQGICDEFDMESKITDPEQYLAGLHENINRRLFNRGEGQLTLTLLSMAVNLQTLKFFYCNSGHPAPLLLELAGSKQESLSARNSSIIGSRGDFHNIEIGCGDLNSNECIIMYTDGLQEAISDSERKLSIKSLFRLFRSIPETNVTALHGFVLEQIQSLSVFERSDDVTMVTIKKSDTDT